MKKSEQVARSAYDASALWDAARGYMRVLLRDVEVEVRVGLHPWEKYPERPTRLVVNVELFAHVPPAGSLSPSGKPLIDYDDIREELRKWPGRPHTPLLESLVDELVRLAFRNPHVEACRVSIVKPDVFNEAAGAGVEVYRLRHELKPAST
ncbi:MAG TPA: dihydroneopterin aldolase [Alphaproteobacteria bacterium]|nr:dihydroneopterin aldolase [Alphaproteobacteria bacterium]